MRPDRPVPVALRHPQRHRHPILMGAFTVVLVLFGFADASRANDTCGGHTQRECLFFEQFPSCDAGLTAAEGKCWNCGANGERECAATVQIPSCDAGLMAFGGRCEACGAAGERACPLTVQFPSCDAGLAEVGGRCSPIQPVQPFVVYNRTDRPVFITINFSDDHLRIHRGRPDLGMFAGASATIAAGGQRTVSLGGTRCFYENLDPTGGLIGLVPPPGDSCAGVKFSVFFWKDEAEFDRVNAQVLAGGVMRAAVGKIADEYTGPIGEVLATSYFDWVVNSIYGRDDGQIPYEWALNGIAHDVRQQDLWVAYWGRHRPLETGIPSGQVPNPLGLVSPCVRPAPARFSLVIRNVPTVGTWSCGVVQPPGSVSPGADPAGDADNDGLTNAFEIRYGMDPLRAEEVDGANADPDGDGFTDAMEEANGTHPRGFHSRYLAEGATGTFFDTRLALVNPENALARVLVRYQDAHGVTRARFLEVAPLSRATVAPSAEPGLEAAEFSTVVESDQPIVVDRTLTWNAASGYGAHAETGVAATALTWYLAEGSTVGRFNLFYLLQNPGAAEAQVRVRYLRPVGVPLEKTYTLPANSRSNIWVNQEEFPGLGRALAGTDVSAVIEALAATPIIVERAMYLDTPGQMFAAGHESAGITTPSTTWFLAEGATGAFFDLFVLIANPTDTTADVEATWLLPDGRSVVKTYGVPANSRFTIWVDQEDAALADTAVSTTLRATNGVPIIVERSMWWPGDGWYESHNSPGSTTTGTRWALAEGEVDAARNLETYVLIANTSATTADVRVTLLFEDGTSAARTYHGIPARSRFNVAVGGFFPEAAGRRFGAIVESLGGAAAQIVVERAVYWDAAGQPWAAGTNALGTRLQ